MTTKPNIIEDLIPTGETKGSGKGPATLLRCYHSTIEVRDHLLYLEEKMKGKGTAHEEHPNGWQNLSNRAVGRPGFVGREWESADAMLADMTVKHDDTLRRLEECVEELRGIDFPRPESIRYRPKIREDGERLHLQRYRDGDPNCYYVNRRVKMVGGHQTIVLAQASCASHRDKADDVAWRAASGMAVAQLLHEAGYQVEYWIFNRTERPFAASCHKNIDLEIACMLKGGNEPPDWVRLSNMASNWMFRTVQMALYCHEDLRGKPAEPTIGMGHATYNYEDLIHANKVIEKGRPILPINVGGSGSKFSKKSAIDAARAAMESYLSMVR